MTWLIGWTFVLLCPFCAVGGLLIIGAVVYDQGLIGFAYALAWMAVYALWFDGSKYQKAI